CCGSRDLGAEEALLSAEAECSSIVEATVQPVQSSLPALLEISANLSRTLELDLLLPKIVDSLFQLFTQADRCFIILAEEGTTRLLPKVLKPRRPQDETNARFSRALVKQCLETAQGFLSEEARSDERVPLSQSRLDVRTRSVACVPLCNVEGKA